MYCACDAVCTGSGLGTYVLQQLEEAFPEVHRFTTCVFPSKEDDVITSPYNRLPPPILLSIPVSFCSVLSYPTPTTRLILQIPTYRVVWFVWFCLLSFFPLAWFLYFIIYFRRSVRTDWRLSLCTFVVCARLVLVKISFACFA